MQGFVNYKNIRIHFSSEGKGNVVVLIHGFLENRTMWKDIVPILAKKNRVITIDLLGHGETDCLGYVHTMEEQAKVTKTVLNHLKLRKYTLIGHSMGGYIALAFADLFPKTIKGLCLMNSTYKNDDDELKLYGLVPLKWLKATIKTLLECHLQTCLAKIVKLFLNQKLKML